MIIDTYFSPSKTFPELRQLMDSHAMDPLREFGEVCREIEHSEIKLKQRETLSCRLEHGRAKRTSSSTSWCI
jgi:hypothetical protein